MLPNFISLLLVIRSSKVLAVPLEKTDVQMHECVDQRPCEVGHHGCGGLSFVDLNWTRHAVEPRTGIEFPMILDQFLDAENASSSDSEVKAVISLLFMDV